MILEVAVSNDTESKENWAYALVEIIKTDNSTISLMDLLFMERMLKC